MRHASMAALLALAASSAWAQSADAPKGPLEPSREKQDAAVQQQIQKRVQLATEKLGHVPADWHEVVQAGFLRGVPLDPKGRPFILMPDGRVQYSHPDEFPFVELGLPKNRETNLLLK